MRGTPRPIVLPVFQGRRGHPVLFARSVFDEIRRAPESVGARQVVWDHQEISWKSKCRTRASAAMSIRPGTTARFARDPADGGDPMPETLADLTLRLSQENLEHRSARGPGARGCRTRAGQGASGPRARAGDPEPLPQGPRKGEAGSDSAVQEADEPPEPRD